MNHAADFCEAALGLWSLQAYNESPGLHMPMQAHLAGAAQRVFGIRAYNRHRFRVPMFGVEPDVRLRLAIA